MNRILCLLLLATTVSAFAQFDQLVWSDEFDGDEVDPTKWAYETGDGCPNLCGWGNGELEYYTEGEDNVTVENGVLTIEVQREARGGSSFTSSKLLTRGLHSWTYGRFEARMRLPLGNGLWPAFWMLSINNDWPMTGEIDIMEYRGDRPDETHGTLHYGAPWPNNRYDGGTYSHDQSLAEDFHIYAVEWDEESIRWYFDDVLFKTETKNPNSLNPPPNGDVAWPWDSDFYMILNFAVGGGFAGNPSANQVQLTKPTFEIDYVRVYSDEVVGCADNVTISGKNNVLAGSTQGYATTEYENASYRWAVEGGVIIDGVGTSAIEVLWENEGEFNVEVDITYSSDSECPGKVISDLKMVEVERNDCVAIYADFEDESGVSASSGSANLVDNPSPSTVNSSERVIMYNRDARSTYDVIFIDDLLLNDGSEYENGNLQLELDVYTDQPVGTEVQVQVASTLDWQEAWPVGRHTVYSAVTTTVNEWETLSFELSETGDPNRSAYEDRLDRIVILLDPNTNNGGTYYLDNIKKTSTNAVGCSVTNVKNVIEIAEAIKFYPQPMGDELKVAGAENIVFSVKLYDLVGYEVASYHLNGNQTLDVSQLTPGLYSIEYKVGDILQRIKLIKQ